MNYRPKQALKALKVIKGFCAQRTPKECGTDSCPLHSWCSAYVDGEPALWELEVDEDEKR